MDPRIVKGLVVLVAIAVQLYTGVPVSVESLVALLSGVGIGAVVVRRPGDLAPLSGRGDS